MEEKSAHPESMATVNIKPEYPPSEYCSSEPPPAYHKPQSSAVQVAKIVAVTVVLVSFVLGSFLLASAYVTANASCRQLEQDLELLSQVADKFEDGSQGPLQPEALIQEEPKHAKRQSTSLNAEASKKVTKEITENNIDNDSTDSGSSSAESDEAEKVNFKLPLQLNLDELASALVSKNQKSKMNCIVEKKKAEEIVDHQPKTVRLPFGVNLTTDPRLERVTGERMVIICESGNVQSMQPQQPEKQQPEEEDDEDNDQETIMIQPVMIPIPQTPFQTHMPHQMPPIQNQVQPQIQIRPIHPMETMRPPMPPMRQSMDQMNPAMEAMRPPMMHQYRPVMEPMRPPMRPPMEVRPMMEQEARPTIERIIAFRQNMEPSRNSIEPQRPQEVEQERPQMMVVPQHVQIRVEAQYPQPQSQQGEADSPNPIIQHIIQQIIAQKIMEQQKAQEQESQSQESSEQQYEPAPQAPMPQRVIAQRIPLPEEVLTQLNRLPNNDRVIVAVSEPESSEEKSSEEEESQEVSMPSQEQRQPVQPVPQDMMNREAYARRLPVNIPVNMMQLEQDQESEAATAETSRPHFVQPRAAPIGQGPPASPVRPENE